MKRGILVVGSLNMDMSVNIEMMPAVGETIIGNGMTYQVGGKGANQACACGKLGGNVKMLGSVGTDEFGDRQIESLETAGVDTSHLKRSKKQPTGTAVIYVDRNGDNSIVVLPGANQECDEKYLQEQKELFSWCDLIVLQMEIPYQSVLYAAKTGKKMGKTIILNPAPAPECLPDELLELVDYLTPNETELEKLSGETKDDPDGIKRGARNLIEKGVENVVVTLGEQGALLVNRSGETLYPGRRVRAVDTTAAGDCFNGALAVALADGMAEHDAICFANLSASFAVMREGAQNSLPDREDVEAYKDRY